MVGGFSLQFGLKGWGGGGGGGNWGGVNLPPQLFFFKHSLETVRCKKLKICKTVFEHLGH